MGRIRILSHSYIRYKDRQEAGRLLAKEIDGYKGQQVVVLGIPRGGIIVAHELALALDAELDIVLAHKLGTPGHTELAMGSVSEDGKIFLNEDVINQFSISKDQIEGEKSRQLTEINRRASAFRKVHTRISLIDKIAIVTDDGVATGATTLAALWAARRPTSPTGCAASAAITRSGLAKGLKRDKQGLYHNEGAGLQRHWRHGPY